ncbi:MAG: hypothetical protein J5676_10130 [Bacteroidaceae bacterium]|nr:hypothetical protein [Bacteroidaceae bacterium]
MNKLDFRRHLISLFELLPLPTVKPSEKYIDVVIPIIPKDLRILPLCIEGVRKCVTNNIKDIYIVSPHDVNVLDLCANLNLKFIDEKEVLGFSPKEINLKVQLNGELKDRSGWLFQQILKLSGKVGTCENYLCIDADHILLKPHTFLSAVNTPVFYMSEECHIPYYDNIKKMLGLKQFSMLSYVAHKMIFNKRCLAMLHGEIEQRYGCDWIFAIVDNYDRREKSGFSEFEMYGNYVSEKILRPWKQKELKYEMIADYYALQKKYAKYNSVTFPAYLSKI